MKPFPFIRDPESQGQNEGQQSKAYPFSGFPTGIDQVPQHREKDKGSHDRVVDVDKKRRMINQDPVSQSKHEDHIHNKRQNGIIPPGAPGDKIKSGG